MNFLFQYHSHVETYQAYDEIFGVIRGTDHADEWKEAKLNAVIRVFVVITQNDRSCASEYLQPQISWDESPILFR